jgi:hypothetical protein
MGLLGLFILLIALVPMLLACALAAAALGTVARVLLEARAARRERLALRDAPHAPARMAEPAVRLEPAP